MVWTPSLSRDRKWPRVTKSKHSRLVDLESKVILLFYRLLWFPFLDRSVCSRRRPNFGFVLGTDTGGKLSFGVGSISVGCTAASFGFGQISAVVSALCDLIYLVLTASFAFYRPSLPMLSGRNPRAVSVPVTLSKEFGKIYNNADICVTCVSTHN